MLINNSRIKTHSECNRRFYWNFVYHGGLVRRAVNKHFAFGTMMHHLLAYYYGEQDWKGEADNALRIAVPGFDQFPDLEKEFWLEQQDWAVRMMTEYVKWAPTVDKFSVKDIETEDTVVLGLACYTCGEEYPAELSPTDTMCTVCNAEIHHLAHKIDLTVIENGHVFPLDHKTTSGFGDSYFQSWHHSPQMYLYLHGTRKHYPQANRFQMNFLRKAKQVGTMKEKCCSDCRNGVRKKVGCSGCSGAGKVLVPAVTPPPFHREAPVRMRPEFMDRVLISRVSTCNDIREGMDTGLTEETALTTWKMNPDRCFDRGTCPYLDLCWSKGNAAKWFHPSEEVLDGYLPRPKDYVTLAQEESD